MKKVKSFIELLLWVFVMLLASCENPNTFYKSNLAKKRHSVIRDTSITQIDPYGTMDNLNLTHGNSTSIIIPFEPDFAEYDFSVELDYNRSYPSDYQHMLHYEIQDNSLVISSLEDYNFNGYKSIIGNIPLRIRDSLSGNTKEINVRIIPKETDVIPITSIPDVYSDNYDYEIDLSSEKKYQLYSCTLTAGKGYLFWSTGTYNSTLSVYNSSYSRTNCYSFTSRYRMVCLPKQSGTYYLSVSNYNTEHPDNTVKFYVYEITLITDFTLSETSLTMQSGDTKTFQISSYTPPEAYAEFSLNNTGTRITSNTISGNVITMNAWVPGIDDVIVYDNITGISKACNVTITSDPAKEIDISVTGTAASTILSDYTVVNLTAENYAVVNKLQLEAGKTYHFQHVDSIHQSTGNSDDRNGTIDCYYYLEDSTFHYLSRVDDWDMDYRCTKSGLYYYIITAFSFRNTGKGYYYIWAEDTP